MQSGITGLSHTLLQPLEPGTQYLWSVRARYAVHDTVYVTRWSESRLPLYAVRTGFLPSEYANRPGMPGKTGAAAPDLHSKLWSPCALDFIPDANYYRFNTKPVEMPESATSAQTRGSFPFSPVGAGVPATGGTDGMFARKH